MQIFKDLGELLTALRAVSAAGSGAIRAEAEEVMADVIRINERSAIHNAHVIVANVLRENVFSVPGFANYLFGAESAGTVKITEHCTRTSELSASVRMEANTGTHDILVTFTRMPKVGSGLREGMHIDRVCRAIERVDERRTALSNAIRMADTIGLTNELGSTLADDSETFELVSECLEFLRQMFVKENENSRAE